MINYYEIIYIVILEIVLRMQYHQRIFGFFLLKKRNKCFLNFISHAVFTCYKLITMVISGYVYVTAGTNHLLNNFIIKIFYHEK